MKIWHLLFIKLLLLLVVAVNCNYYGHPQFTTVGNKEYFIENSNKVAWFVAMNNCLKLNAKLATINNSTEMSEMNDWLMTQGFSEGDWIWIDGLGMRGNYLSFAKSGPMPYAKWWNGQPDDFGSNESCVNLYRKNNEFYMNDWHCRQNAYFICEQ